MRSTPIKDEATQSICHLRTLGDWELRDPSGRVLPRPGRKAFALLVYLALAPGERAPRDRLADLLWPDRSSAQARSSLRQTLSVIRATLGETGARLFAADREFIALAPGVLSCDARELIEIGERTDGIGVDHLYRGSFLAGFFSGSQVFEDWAADFREKLDTLAVQLLHAELRGLPPDRALPLFPRLLAIDPAREASFQLGMELHAALRQRDRALRLYESCKAMLLREYGVSPSPETERIRRRLVEGLPAESLSPASLPERPSRPKPVVRVMRFANLSGDAALDRFLDGLLDALLIDLSHMRELTALRAPEAGAPQAYADYMLTGSLMEQGGRIEVISSLPR